MTNVALMLGIPTQARPAYVALVAALDRLADQGRTPVCARRPDAWSSEAPAAVRREAAAACGWCPARVQCAAYAVAADERHGVWGGNDRGARPKRKAAA